ncbi:hypothetical protein ACHMW7_12090 [Aminobacter sp. UC22_36]|uniref:hypothetical protein n=1 Tax=Aminobacter sp. UC22_36 TaxID=3374549 RepID=UPI0037575355
MSFFLNRHLAGGLLAASLALGALVLPARALTVDEVGKVVQLLGELEPELGRLAYDDEEADQWFDDDAGLEGRIAKAGFDRESWKEALGATFRGYLATIAAERFEATFSGLTEKVETSDLNAEQKAEMRSFVATKIAETRAMRAEGERYVDAVQPYATRLNELLGDGNE